MMPKKVNLKKLLNFITETGQLKRVKRSGWWVAGIKEPESVAEHCFRCAIIGYILAKMEGADTHKVLLMTLLNDIHESRINDLHKMGHRYIDFRKAERKVYREQLNLLPKIIREDFSQTRREYNQQKSQAAIVARDADILECILQAKEYFDFGFQQTKSFISAGKKFLATKSAKAIAASLIHWNSRNWWLHLKKFQR